MMKYASKVLLVGILATGLFSCSEDTDDAQRNILTMDVSAITEVSSVELVWIPVEGASWYKISIAKDGDPLVQVANYQDLINDPIRYTIEDLEPGTVYDAKIEGTDYASGGKLIASHSFSLITQKE